MLLRQLAKKPLGSFSQQRLDTALSKYVSKAADSDSKIAHDVLMYREKPAAKWVGSYIVRGASDKLVTLDTGDRTLIAPIDKLKPYRQNNIVDNAMIMNKPKDSDSDIFQRERAQLEALLNKPRVAHGAKDVVKTFVTKVVKDDDPRAHAGDF